MITNSIKKGDLVTFLGLGAFKDSKLAACIGRNLRTGSELKIAARNASAFSASKALNDTVNE